MTVYAKGTEVPVAKSAAEIETLLGRYGAEELLPSALVIFGQQVALVDVPPTKPDGNLLAPFLPQEAAHLGIVDGAAVSVRLDHKIAPAFVVVVVQVAGVAGVAEPFELCQRFGTKSHENLPKPTLAHFPDALLELS
jgi:hypothetical protein